MSFSSIPQAKLGKYGPHIPALGFGIGNLSGVYGSAGDNEQRFKVLDQALEQGNIFWDSSTSYGDNEEMLGEWFRRTGKRDSIFLSSKFGILMDRGTWKFLGVDSTAEHCKRACKDSLERMGIKQIDLYYAHRLNPDTSIEETMRALAELKEEGKIKYIGLSEISSNTLRRACKIAHVDAVQMEYSPFQLDVENVEGTNLLETCRELGVAMVCYSPLGRGLWTGRFTSNDAVSEKGDMRGAYFPRFSEENMAKNLKLLEQFRAFADKKGCTTAQLSLAWLRKQGEDVIAIPGTKRVEALEENWASLKVDLDDKEAKEIRDFAESIEVAGFRSAPASKAFSFIDTKEEA